MKNGAKGFGIDFQGTIFRLEQLALKTFKRRWHFIVTWNILKKAFLFFLFLFLSAAGKKEAIRYVAVVHGIPESASSLTTGGGGGPLLPLSSVRCGGRRRDIIDPSKAQAIHFGRGPRASERRTASEAGFGWCPNILSPMPPPPRGDSRGGGGERASIDLGRSMTKR